MPDQIEKVYCQSFRVGALIDVLQRMDITEIEEGNLANFMDVLSDEANTVTTMLDGLSTQTLRVIQGSAS